MRKIIILSLLILIIELVIKLVTGDKTKEWVTRWGYATMGIIVYATSDL